ETRPCLPVHSRQILGDRRSARVADGAPAGCLLSGTQPLLTAGITALALLCGSVPFGLLFTHLFAGADVRESGSGNIGAANVSRVAGTKVGALVLVADLVKGLVPVLVGRLLGLNPVDLAIIAGA